MLQASKNDLSARPTLPRAILVFVLLNVLAATMWSFYDPQAQFLVFGALACGIVTLPMLQGDYDLLSTWSLVASTVYIGCGFRSYFVAFGINGSRTVNDLFLLNHTASFFFWPSVLYLAGLALMATAYSQKQRARELSGFGRYLRDYRFGPLLHVVVALCAAIGFITFILYARHTGGLSLSRISAKRTTISGLELGPDYKSFGQLRAVNALSSYAFWLLLADFAQRRVRHSLLTLRGLVLAVLFINAAALPVYASSRTSVAYLLIVAAAIQVCLGKSNVKRRVLAQTGLAVVAALAVLTTLRVESQSANGQPAAFTPQAVVLSVGDALVFNRNFSDIPTTSQIIRAVPDKLPYMHGETIVGWLAAPIPRSAWPDKPLISAGPIIGAKVFNTNLAGVPPGFIGEMYWNFSLPGVLVGSWLLGYFLRRIYGYFRASIHLSPAAGFFYCVVPLRFGGDVMTDGVGQAVFGAVTTAVVVVVLLTLVGERKYSLEPEVATHPALARNLTGS